MVENFNVFDFVLAEDDMQAVREMDGAESLFFSHYDPATVEYLTNRGKQ